MPLHPELRASYRSTFAGAVWLFGVPGLALLVRSALGPFDTREQIGTALLYGLVGAILELGTALYKRLIEHFCC